MIRTISAVAVALVVFTTGATAQQSRVELLRSAQAAYDNFAPERALDFVKAAVNPALGPSDSAWVRGVHLLTQILMEAENREQARTWARWAIRTAPGMQIDTVNFLAGVVAAFREAATFTGSRTFGDAVTSTTWRWPQRGSTESSGRISIGQSPLPVPVSVRVVGGGLISGAGLTLPPGSYEIEAGAPGYLPARVTREVLPGVTTLLTFSLTPATVASNVIADDARRRAFGNIATLTTRRFSTAPSCAAGAFVGRDGLVLTTYEAIRGADSIALGGAGPAAAIRVLAHDVAANLAVLQVPGARADSMVPTPVIADGMSAWAVRLTNCAAPAEARVRVTQWSDRPRGALQLTEAPEGAAAGSPLFDVEGRLVGLWTGASGAIAFPNAVALIDRARRNLGSNQTMTVAELARRENHAYGSFVMASDVNAASVRIAPMESWHWSSLQTTGTVPLTFIGPMGRYRVEVTAPAAAGGMRGEREITIRPGVHERVVIPIRNVAAGGGAQRTVAGRRRSKLPWILGGVAALGAGAALALGGGGGGDGGGGGGGGNNNTGSIGVTVPVNP